jgi:hypothetical protein
MSSNRLSDLARLIVASALALAAACAAAQERGPVRVDNWAYYQRNTDDSQQWQYRLRFDIPFRFSSGWEFLQRAYLPLLLYTDRTGPANPDGGWKAGIGDWFFDEFFTTPELAKNMRGMLGVRFVLPTGGRSPFGSGQYQWAPVAGFVYDIPDMGLRFAPMARYFMSFHASEDGAGQVRRLDLYPTVSKALGNGWTVRVYDENPISYNNVSEKWFVPLDAQLVKRARKDLEFAFGAAYGLVRDDPRYLTQAYARVSLYF